MPFKLCCLISSTHWFSTGQNSSQGVQMDIEHRYHPRKWKTSLFSLPSMENLLLPLHWLKSVHPKICFVYPRIKKLVTVGHVTGWQFLEHFLCSLQYYQVFLRRKAVFKIIQAYSIFSTRVRIFQTFSDYFNGMTLLQTCLRHAKTVQNSFTTHYDSFELDYGFWRHDQNF